MSDDPRLNLLAFSSNTYSQNGEDGIVRELCRRLGVASGTCVEFGAWDGRHLSNTYRLLLEENWQGVYIEGRPDRYGDLVKNVERFGSRVETLCRYVGWEGEQTLDRILASTWIPPEFDLLSIDIDSYDWQVWASLENYRPRIVIVECNSRIPPGIWQVHEEGVTQGASFSALVGLGRDKGYALVCHTGNLIFVRRERVHELGLDPRVLRYPELLFNGRRHRQELASGSVRSRLARLAFNLLERAAAVKRRLAGSASR